MADLDQEKLIAFLKRYGLTDPKWLVTLQNMGIKKPEDILSVEDKEKAFQFLYFMATPSEKDSLTKLLSSKPTSAVDKVHKILEEAGLDVRYWSTVLANQAGVMTVQGLDHIHDEFYPHLVQFARCPEERKTLQVLLKMENDDAQFLERHERYVKIFKRRKCVATEMLEKMKEFHNKGKPFEDKDVQDLSTKILETLQVPKEFWFSEITYKSFIDKIEGFYHDMSICVDETKVLEGSDVVLNASNGQALRGIYGDTLSEKKLLAHVPKGIILQAPFYSQHCKHIHCTGKDEETMVKKEWRMPSKKRPQSIKNQKKGNNSTYQSTMKCFVVPVASCFFKMAHLKLSDDVIERMKKIEKLDAASMQKECKTFFKEFGSHACLGPFHFGGRYEWCCFSCGIQQTDLTTAQTLQKEVIQCYGRMSTLSMVGIASIPGVQNVQCSKQLHEKTYIQVKIEGGPKETTSVAFWRGRLVADCTSWVLLDSGTEEVSVWEIAKRNHYQDLQDASLLAQNMQKVWNRLNAHEIMQSDAQDLIKGIMVWNQKKDIAHCKENLSFLLHKREAVIRKAMNVRVWPTDYLSHRAVQVFLKFAIEMCVEKKPHDNKEIKSSLCQIIGPADLESIPTFPERDYIRQWLFETDGKCAIIVYKDLMLLMEFCFTIALENLHAATKDIESSFDFVGTSQTATRLIAVALSHVRSHFRRTEQVYDEIFLAALLYPFNYELEGNAFLQCLSTSDVSFLKRAFQIHAQIFYKVKEQNDVIKLQAYLILLTSKINKDLDVESVSAHLKCVSELMSQNLDPEIEHILYKSIGKLITIEQAETFLQHIMDTPSKQKYSSQDACAKPSDIVTARNVPAYTLSPIKRRKKCEDLFSMLDLKHLYPQKWTLQQVSEVRDDSIDIMSPGKLCSNPKLYAIVVLKNIISFDHRCRTRLTYKMAPKSSQQEEGLSDSEDEEEETCIHPMDGLLAVLHCADNFLRQNLLNRLAVCQIAIPLVLPDPITDKEMLTLWAMRTIIKQWKSNNADVSHEVPIITYRAPIISFLRLGIHQRSKSHIINVIINDSNHNTFFHYNCDGGSARHRLVAGLVEVSWYLPSPTNNAFSDAITFVNMHGDARCFSRQMQFLSEISFMLFVLLTGDDLDDSSTKLLQTMCKVPGGIVLLRTRATADNAVWHMRYKHLRSALDEKTNCSVIRLDKKNEADIKDCIREKIVSSIKAHWTNGSKSHPTLEECNIIATRCGIKVDEDDQQCVQGKQMAEKFKSILVNIRVQRNPKDMLILQGPQLWHEWGKKEKERYRQKHSEMEGVPDYSLRLGNEMASIRKKQQKYVQQLSENPSTNPLMDSFLTSLLSSKGNIRNYYLHWLKTYLDNFSREDLPPLHSEYKQKRDQLIALQLEKEKKQSAIEQCKKDMEELNIRLINASFGLEHLLREIGQIYEAVKTTECCFPIKQYLHLPRVAAELLIEGYPLELMDGDAAHVPIHWVSAVLEQVKECLCDPPILVLSILGLQSTGKSTLLNTVFGVNFSVSAGRCTRGAFMQLIPLHSSLKNVCKCCYFLLVDTEGLRAPELDAMQTKNHDNQLATFVIGLANLTVINIYGETPADMNDILETAVHAFLRMREVTLYPGCHFVHQNVSAVMASDKGMMGRSKMKAKLDKMTKIAAKEAGLEGGYESFNDVIRFRDEKDVSYFPTLWIGDPPMAPVNPSYSMKAKDLRCSLVSFAKESKERAVKFSSFHKYLDNFWKAILRENFIFSFKNTLEVSAYSVLDNQRSKWSWSFMKDMITWEDEFEAVVMAHPKNNQEAKDNLFAKADSKYRELKGEMAKFFKESNEREILINWQGETDRQLTGLYKELTDRAKRRCERVLKDVEAKAKIEELKTHHRTDITERVKSLVTHLEKEPLTDAQQSERFEEQWKEWIKVVQNVQMREAERDIKLDVQIALKQHFEEKYLATLLQKQNPDDGGKPLEQWGRVLVLLIEERHIVDYVREGLKEKFINFVRRMPKKADHWRDMAVKETKHYLREVEKYLKSKKSKDYNPSFTTEILQMLNTEIDNFKSDTFKFSVEYRIDLALTACGYALIKFNEMAIRFRDERDPVKCLEAEKARYLHDFKDYYKQTAQEKIAARHLCEIIERQVENKVIKSLPLTIVDEMKKDNDFLLTKPSLIKRGLKSIGSQLKKRNFDGCYSYLQHPMTFLQDWVRTFTEDFCDFGSPSRLNVYVAEKLQEIMEFLNSAVNEVTKNYSEKFQVGNWVVIFKKKVEDSKKLILEDTVGWELGYCQTENDIHFFTAELLNGLNSVEKALTMKLQLKAKCMETWERRPYDLIYEQVSGCIAACPFCREPCNDTNKHHEGNHTVTLHRPQCLGGWRSRGTEEMVLETCTQLVSQKRVFHVRYDSDETHPYETCEKIYPKWKLQKDLPGEASLYWKYVVTHFKDELTKLYSMEEASIPDDWKALELTQALEDL